MQCVIVGSYRKFYPDIRQVITIFENGGISVLSPPKSRIVNPGSSFAIFETDKSCDVHSIESGHLSALARADFVYFYDPQGYTGINAAFELGCAWVQGIPIIALERTGNPALDCFIAFVCKPEDLGFYVQEVSAQRLHAEEVCLVQ